MLNLVNYLKKLGLENPEDVAAKLAAADESPETVDAVLTASQAYAKPFLESDFNQKVSEERKTWKGKYFKELTLKFNKTFGGLLTNSEIDEILSDPANEGKTFDAVLLALKEKATESMTPKELAEYKKMIDAQSAKITEYEEKMAGLESEYEQKFNDKLNQTKLDGLVDTELLSHLPKITSMNPTAAAKVIRTMIGGKALLKIGADGTLGLFDPKNPDAPLKKSGTEFYKFSELVSELATEAELPAIKSGGSGGGQPPQSPNQPQPKEITNPAAKSASALADIVGAMG